MAEGTDVDEPREHRIGNGSDTGGSAKRIGRYRVESVLGTGAFATVYRGVDERLDDQVAIKVLAENHSLDPDLRARFITEGRVLRRIDNPHVLRVYDLGETVDNQPYLVLEYAERGTMTARVAALRRQGWVPSAEDLWSVAGPLARALRAVHRAQAVHRDLNPSNVLLVASADGCGQSASASVLVGEQERLVLADLGMCKDLALNSGHTSAGGTEGFRPPELRHGPAIIDERADLWSLSAVLVWLATGVPPGDDVSPASLATAGVPEAMCAPLSRSLAADPHERHVDAAEWLHDMESSRSPWRPPAVPDVARPAEPGRLPAGRAGLAESPRTAPLPVGSPRRGLLHSPIAGRPYGAGAEWEAMSFGAKLWQSWWLLALLPFGLLTWAAFLYIGIRTQHARWLWAAGVYATAITVMIVLAFFAPTDAAGRADVDSPQGVVATILLAAVWLGGIIHGLIANKSWLRSRAAQRARAQAEAGTIAETPGQPVHRTNRRS